MSGEENNVILISTGETFLAVCDVSSAADLVSAQLFATLVTCALVMASGCRPSVIMWDKTCSAQAAVRTQTRNMVTSLHVAVRLLWPLTGLHLGTQWAFLQRGQHRALVEESLTSVVIINSSKTSNWHVSAPQFSQNERFCSFEDANVITMLYY